MDDFQDLPSIETICKEFNISVSELENNDSKFLELLSKYLKRRLIKLIYLEDKMNSYIENFSKEVDLYLKIDGRLGKQSTSEDLLLSKLNQLSSKIKPKVKSQNISKNLENLNQ